MSYCVKIVLPLIANKTLPLARVVKVHPGTDQTVRVATLKIGNREFQGPVSKLICLVEAEQPDPLTLFTNQEQRHSDVSAEEALLPTSRTLTPSNGCSRQPTPRMVQPTEPVETKL